MPIALIACAALVWLARPASAEDFSGFYAGVNAGYAFQAGHRERHGIGTDALKTGAPPNDTGLPPSAQEASRALQSRSQAPGSGAALTR
ncbi:hypothetical protein MKK58_11350 [Methylobacterium sp. J-078]|uniref:hypothetical protein n=1 Tax=Methylobacterium sp. J-078 TaxID=2836657 RepID=UPI001FB9D709|nr:hypothetical protein [Methylobacterium sp. J-078]MCJ2045119.1 hypothetical protein [Methylobacterium sp. J-078]